MEIYDNCLHTKYPLLWQIFTFGIIFPPMSYFLLRNVHCCLPWKRWEWCGKHLLRAGPPGAWPPQALPLSESPSQQATLCHPWRSPIPFASLDSRYFVLSSEPPRRPRTGLEQRPWAHVPAVTWPATLPGLPRYLPHFCPSPLWASHVSKQRDSRDNPWTSGWHGHIATVPGWVEITPSCMSTGWAHTTGTPREPLEVRPHMPWQSSLRPVAAPTDRDNLWFLRVPPISTHHFSNSRGEQFKGS